MKILISHDVDHLTVWEHRNDLIIPKHIIRSFMELLLGYSTAPEIIYRFHDIFKNKWHNLEELAEFDKQCGVPSTFLFAVRNGRCLNYSLQNMKIWIKRIQEMGFDVGVHGIGFNNMNEIVEEYNDFRKLMNLDKFGIRVHDIGVEIGDVRLTAENLNILDRAGYSFSSNTFEWKNPFRVGKMWEFPVNIMDGYIMEKNARWQNQTLEQAMQDTERLISKANSTGLEYFSILFHDIFFSNSYMKWKEWYCWLIDYINKGEFEFISYHKAVQELERN